MTGLATALRQFDLNLRNFRLQIKFGLYNTFVIHKPHPDNTMKGYRMKQILDYLKQHNKLTN
jgi:hypothetical protein